MDRDVKHGCCSCTHYKLPMNKEPCKGCKRWSRWEDKPPNEQAAEKKEGCANGNRPH